MLVEPAHRAAVDRLPDLMRHATGYHVGWWDAHGQPTGNTVLADIADLAEESGARSWAQTEADRRLGLALDCLAQAVPDGSGAADLLALADLVTRRDH